MAVSDHMALLIDSVVFTNDGSSADASDSLDISGCDTFTQIVDKLSDGQGYTNVKIGSEDALLVSTGTYDNGDDGTFPSSCRPIAELCVFAFNPLVGPPLLHGR